MKRIAIILITICFLNSAVASAQQEDQYKALFIKQFTKYIKWSGNSGKVKVAVIGDSPVAVYLDKLQAKAGNIEVIKIEDIGQAIDAQILFIEKDKSKLVAEAHSKLANHPVLIITEQEGTIKKGSAINFVVRNNRLTFEISKAMLDRRDVMISGELKRLGILI